MSENFLPGSLRVPKKNNCFECGVAHKSRMLLSRHCKETGHQTWSRNASRNVSGGQSKSRRDGRVLDASLKELK